MNCAEHSWYAVATKPRQEDLVCRVYDLYNIGCFLPEILVPNSPSMPDSSDSAAKHVFPEYRLVDVVPDAVEWARVHYTPDIEGVASFGGIPVGVPHEVVSELRERVMGNGTPDVARLITDGDTVMTATAGRGVLGLPAATDRPLMILWTQSLHKPLLISQTSSTERGSL